MPRYRPSRYLVQNYNYFGRIGGFDAIRDRLQSAPTSISLSMCEAMGKLVSRVSERAGKEGRGGGSFCREACIYLCSGFSALHVIRG